jgi:hypothetical protein
MVYVEVGSEYFIMEPDDAVEIPRGVDHSFTGVTDATILEVSTQHFEEDSYRQNKSRKLNFKDRLLLWKVLKKLRSKRGGGVDP